MKGDRVCILRTTPAPQMQIRDGKRLRAWQPTPVFLPGESHGQRSLAGYSPWGPTESDTSEETEYACMNLRADSTAKDFRINTEEVGGLEQRETEKHEPEPKNKARENATEQTGRVIGSAGSQEYFSQLQMSAEALSWGDH